MREKSAFKGEVNLRGAKVGGQLSVIGSIFEALLNMNNLEVGQSMFLGDGATFRGEVILRDAKVGGQLNISGSTFETALSMSSLEVGQNLYMREKSAFKGDVDLIGARVEGSIDLSDADFHKITDCTSAIIEGELRLGSSIRARSRWQPTAWLILRNTRVGAIQDRIDKLPDGTRQDAWPGQNLQLDGFTYERLGGLLGEGASEMMDRPVSWYVNWLQRDSSFSPQPYRHLAGIFREAGADGKANAILYALREQERVEAWRRSEYGSWFGLTLLKWVIGYGIGTGYFRSLWWVAGLTLAGALVLKRPAEMCGHGWNWCAWASFDEMLPAIELDERHTKFIHAELWDWRRYYFYGHRIVAFVLASFVIAGLAGLTQGV